MKRRGLIVAGALSLILAMAVACGGDDDGASGAATKAPTATSPPVATATATSPPAATATPTSPPPATATPTTAPAIDKPDDGLVAAGKELYLNVPDNAAPQALWCFQCHLIEGIDGAAGLIGPDHSHLATEAAGRVPGMTVEEYIRHSIEDPEAFVAEGVDRSTPGLMTNAITEKLTEEQIDALVAFLMTLE